MNNSETTIDLIRHGEPVGGRMYRGNQVDHPLSETGWQQMHAAISQRYLQTTNLQTINSSGEPSLSSPPLWDLIITSPMLRCYNFADVLSKQLDIPIETHPSLTEVCFGEWEGKTAEEIKATDSVLFSLFQRDPVNNRPQGSESLEDFSTRVIDALSMIQENHQGKKILLVTHGGIMRTVLIHCLSSDLKNRQLIRFPYAGMLRIYANNRSMRLEFL